MSIKHADYLVEPLTMRKPTINKAVKRLRYLMNKGLEFDAIACCGVSGLLVAPSIADRLSVNITVVRKKVDTTVSSYAVETIDSLSYIVIDDLVYNGTTLSHIINLCGKDLCRGVYLYSPQKHVTRTFIENICPLLNASRQDYLGY